MFVSAVMGNSQRLDGGALFGNAPRALWSRWHEPDEANRIALACRSALVQTGQNNILLETGIGAFFAPEQRDRFGVVEDGHVLLESLSRLGLSHEDITAVVLSHLHFDHAGGLLSAHLPGREPSLLFPNAHFVVSRTAFARAQNPHPRDRASFIPQLPELLLTSGRLLLVDERQPHVPELGTEFAFHHSDGHTPGMLLTEVRGTRERLLFCADLVPGRSWVRSTISMGYDRFPELLLDEKLGLLQRALEERTWLFFTHDPDVAAARLTKDPKGQFTTHDEVRRLERFEL